MGFGRWLRDLHFLWIRRTLFLFVESHEVATAMELSMGIPWIFFYFLFLFFQKNVDAINCYICSWSPQDKEVEPDRCSTGNFDERRVRYINCHVGCEIVKILDSNGGLLMFYRNCLMSSPSKFDYDRSHKKSTIMTEEEMYACDSDLCNATSALGSSFLLAFLPLLSSQLLRGL